MTDEKKSPGQIAYEAAGDWVVKHPDESSAKALPRWETLDALAREYWDMIGSAVSGYLLSSLAALVSGEGPVSDSKAIRGLWA